MIAVSNNQIAKGKAATIVTIRTRQDLNVNINALSIDTELEKNQKKEDKQLPAPSSTNGSKNNIDNSREF